MIQINGRITVNVYVIVKNVIYVKNIIFGIVLHALAKWKYIIMDCYYYASIMDDSAITCDEIIESYDEEIKTIPTNFKEKKATTKVQNFYILIVFLLIIIALLIAVSINCYLIKYQAKQKHLLPFHETNDEFREVL